MSIQANNVSNMKGAYTILSCTEGDTLREQQLY